MTSEMMNHEAFISQIFSNQKFIVLTGNYGSGKTEIALHLARHFARFQKTTLVDLDIVNPYFRSGEKAEELRADGIRVLMPTFALTTVDIPALPAEIQSVFESDADRVIFDVGGDDTGAAALGRYYPSFAANRESLATALVVNCMRPLTETPEDIVDLALRIQARGRQRFNLIINNTNLAGQTTPGMLRDGAETVRKCAEQLGIPRLIHAGTEKVVAEAALPEPALILRREMVPEWMVE